MPLLTATRTRARSALLTAAALVIVAAYAALLVTMMSTKPYDTWGAVAFGPLLLLCSVPLIRRVSRDEHPAFFWILLAALALKLVASAVRYAVAEGLYGGAADANMYTQEGARLAEAYRRGDFSADLGHELIGTGALRAITGIVFTVTGRTQLGGYMIFSWWAFWGLVCFYKAFRTGVPDGDHRRYAWLVLFLPSMLYWPSSIGKDAWMLLGLGAAALGTARLLVRRPGAVMPLAAGLAATTIVRPHVTALLCAGLVAAYLLRRDTNASSYLGPITKPLGVLLLALMMTVVVQQTQEYFGVEEEGGSGATQVLDRTAQQTDTGGSDFDAVNARSIADIPAAIVAVMFRPFPWEVDNGQALIASLEGLAILGLLIASLRRLTAIPRMARHRAYVVVALVYTLLFCVAFSSFGNFGILTRQRIQLFPFALIMLALPKDAPTGRSLKVTHDISNVAQLRRSRG